MYVCLKIEYNFKLIALGLAEGILVNGTKSRIPKGCSLW